MISYKPLRVLLAQKDMKITDLNKILPTSVTSKFNKDVHVTTATLERICTFLNCKVQDIIDITPDTTSPKQD